MPAISVGKGLPTHIFPAPHEQRIARALNLDMIVLAGDIGGTNTRLTLADVAINRVRVQVVERFRNDSAGSLIELLFAFLDGKRKPQAICLGVAGPTDGKRVQLTNLDWRIASDEIAAQTGIAKVRLVNDFAAVGHGLSALQAGGYTTLQAGDPQASRPRLAVGAGTGLGVVQCVWMGELYRPLASEGGHIGFAPMNERQERLLHFLQAEHGRVSVERILSGAGIEALYRFCWGEADLPGPAPVRGAAEVSEAALAHSDGAAVAALTLFSRILGQTAGDLALVSQASGGLYLAGGIAPKILPYLTQADFLEGFRDKGRFSQWMESVPVHVVLDEDVGIKGAALAASL